MDRGLFDLRMAQSWQGLSHLPWLFRSPSCHRLQAERVPCLSASIATVFFRDSEWLSTEGIATEGVATEGIATEWIGRDPADGIGQAIARSEMCLIVMCRDHGRVWVPDRGVP